MIFYKKTIFVLEGTAEQFFLSEICSATINSKGSIESPAPNGNASTKFQDLFEQLKIKAFLYQSYATSVFLQPILHFV